MKTISDQPRRLETKQDLGRLIFPRLWRSYALNCRRRLGGPWICPVVFCWWRPGDAADHRCRSVEGRRCSPYRHIACSYVVDPRRNHSPDGRCACSAAGRRWRKAAAAALRPRRLTGPAARRSATAHRLHQRPHRSPHRRRHPWRTWNIDCTASASWRTRGSAQRSATPPACPSRPSSAVTRIHTKHTYRCPPSKGILKLISASVVYSPAHLFFSALEICYYNRRTRRVTSCVNSNNYDNNISL